MSDPFVTIDLHGQTQSAAMRTIDRALRDAGPYTYQLRLVHGYHRGNQSAQYDPAGVSLP